MLLQIYFSFVLVIFRAFLSRLCIPAWKMLSAINTVPQVFNHWAELWWPSAGAVPQVGAEALVGTLGRGAVGVQALGLALDVEERFSVWVLFLPAGLVWCDGMVSSQRWWGCCSAFPSRINSKLVGNMELCRIWAVLTHKIYAFSPWLFPQKWEKHLQGKPILFVNFLI